MRTNTDIIRTNTHKCGHNTLSVTLHLTLGHSTPHSRSLYASLSATLTGGSLGAHQFDGVVVTSGDEHLPARVPGDHLDVLRRR
eukprot:2729614-Pyramimonas_sp.AAC.3